MGGSGQPRSHRRARGKRILRAQSISVRRLSRRNRIFRAAVPRAHYPARKNTRDDRRVSLRKRMPLVRRPRRRARQGSSPGNPLSSRRIEEKCNLGCTQATMDKRRKMQNKRIVEANPKVFLQFFAGFLSFSISVYL